jgi:hypothetical protein
MKLAAMTVREWIGKVAQTRQYGETYIPVASRGGLTAGGIRFSWSYYGKSEQGGGHKHKAYAHDAETGEIVRSSTLRKLAAAIGQQAA